MRVTFFVRDRRIRVLPAAVAAVLLALVFVGASTVSASDGNRDSDRGHRQTITVPGADQFTPFAVTIHAGDVVNWVNSDTDDHTVVSDDPLNSVGRTRVNQLLVGTDSNGGKPGQFQMRFDHPGTFVYYCRFHSLLNASNQPTAPGPRGGIQDAHGNFGTPMMGVITVLGD